VGIQVGGKMQVKVGVRSSWIICVIKRNQTGIGVVLIEIHLYRLSET